MAQRGLPKEKPRAQLFSKPFTFLSDLSRLLPESQRFTVPNENFTARPYLVIWEATQACALACCHCRAEAVPGAHPLQLSRQEASRLIGAVVEAGPELFVITGGDPMMRPDLLDIICEASRKGLRVCLSPSATPRMARADLKSFCEAGLAGISLSLDGPDAASHDAFRGVPGTWRRSMDILERCRHLSLPVQINTTLTVANINRFEEFARMVESIQPASWSLFVLVPLGRAQISDLPSPKCLEHFLNRLSDFAEQVPFRVKTTEAPQFRRILLEREKSNRSKATILGPSTNAGRGFLFISHTGEIYPSGFLPIHTGNIRIHRLVDVYRTHPLFVDLRNPAKLKGKCGRCGFNTVCGGSRARAYAVHGDPFASDPLCCFQPDQESSLP
ncbi:MAG: radical SAM protein [Verrucomicrobiia bacterium]